MCINNTGLLKPSSILGRETVAEKHASIITTKSPLSSEESATSHSDAALKLPLFESPPPEHNTPPPVHVPLGK